MTGLKPFVAADYLWTDEARAAYEADKATWANLLKPAPLDDNWMRVAPGTDAAIWRPWNRETGEL